MSFIVLYFDYRISKMFVETKNEAGELHTVLSSHNNFAGEGDLVAQIVDTLNPAEAKKHVDPHYPYHEILPFFNIRMSKGFKYDEASKTYRAEQYGFLIVDKMKELHMITPFQITKDKTRAFYFVHPSGSGKLPAYHDIESVLQQNQVQAFVDPGSVQAELAKIDPNAKHITRLMVAHTSMEPVNGCPEYYSLMIDPVKKAGKLQVDGSIDFREKDAIVQILRGERVLEKHLEIKPQEGLDIFGSKISPVTLKPKGYQLGENLEPLSGEPLIYVATIAGYLDIEKNKVSIKPILIIKGDVNFESGNIDFLGSVTIKGTVQPGFTVKASGDITVEQSVDSSHLESGGNITVKMGVSGNGNTLIKAKGTISAKFILNSRVEAVGNVEIVESIMNCKVFSNSQIVVSSQHGKILGGEIHALRNIQVNTVGSPMVENTVLSVGMTLEQIHELTEIKEEMKKKKDEIQSVIIRIKNTFGDEIFKDIKNNFKALPPNKQKLFLVFYNQELALQKRYNELVEHEKLIEQEMKSAGEPYIIIKDKVFPGSTIHINKLMLKVDEQARNVRFYESVEEGIIKYGSAS